MTQVMGKRGPEKLYPIGFNIRVDAEFIECLHVTMNATGESKSELVRRLVLEARQQSDCKALEAKASSTA